MVEDIHAIVSVLDSNLSRHRSVTGDGTVPWTAHLSESENCWCGGQQTGYCGCYCTG
jgi:hypothetical protein